MRVAATIARYLLGLIFTVFGLNGFLHFIPAAPPSSPLALQFLTVLTASHYMMPVFAVQLVGGLLLLSGRYVPLALAILAPVIFNILTYHLTMDPGGIILGLIALICWSIVFASVRSNFRGLFESRTTPRPV